MNAREDYASAGVADILYTCDFGGLVTRRQKYSAVLKYYT